MNKRELGLCLFAFSLLLAGCSGKGGGKVKADLQRYGLFGRVRSVRTEKAIFAARGGKWVPQKPWLYNVDTYNMRGKPERQETFDRDGSEVFRGVFFHRAEGQKSGVEGYATFHKGKPFNKLIFRFDDSGNMLEQLAYGPNNVLKFRIRYTDRDRAEMARKESSSAANIKKNQTSGWTDRNRDGSGPGYGHYALRQQRECDRAGNVHCDGKTSEQRRLYV